MVQPVQRSAWVHSARKRRLHSAHACVYGSRTNEQTNSHKARHTPPYYQLSDMTLVTCHFPSLFRSSVFLSKLFLMKNSWNRKRVLQISSSVPDHLTNLLRLFSSFIHNRISVSRLCPLNLSSRLFKKINTIPVQHAFFLLLRRLFCFSSPFFSRFPLRISLLISYFPLLYG